MEIAMPTAGLLLIKERKLLLAYSRNKQCFYLPGGKVESYESAEEALCREIAEELNVDLSPGDLHYYTHITAPAYGEKNGVIMEQDCFLLNSIVFPVASSEISELRYFTLPDYLLENNRAPGALMILQKLQAEGLID
ncbi:MAG TPA: NUDIX domain-containing protein [Chitinophagaceae bacterium]|nr:NUDIX domain-containing protein [Chitinophagaceae bacterium]